MSVGSCRKLTVKDRTGEKHQELDKQVLFLGGQLVEAQAFPPGLDIAAADALLDIGVEPIFWHGAFLVSASF